MGGRNAQYLDLCLGWIGRSSLMPGTPVPRVIYDMGQGAGVGLKAKIGLTGYMQLVVRGGRVSFDPFTLDGSTLGTDLRLVWPEVQNPLVSAHIRPACLQIDPFPAITRLKTGTAGWGGREDQVHAPSSTHLRLKICASVPRCTSYIEICDAGRDPDTGI